jgi:hypothetical protein
MKTSNTVSQTLRHSESGLTWEEKLTNATGSLEVLKAGTIRVRATGATTVTIDGVLAATMSAGEILIFNVGDGNPDDTKVTVTVAIGAIAAFVQVAREVPRMKS